MANSLSFSATAASVAANTSAEEKEQFKILFTDHLKLRDQGKIVYFFPRGMGTKMGAEYLRELATKLSVRLETHVFVHFDVEKSAYRVGQVFDDDNTAVAGCIAIFTAEYPPKDDVHFLGLNLASGFDPQSNHNFELDAVASSSNLPSSAQKIEKIPKPRNMWILYRQDNHAAVLARNPGTHTSQLSKIISDMWRHESPEVKAHYKKLADQEKSEHQLQYPEYKCSPRKSAEIKKRKRPSKECLISIEAVPATKMPRLSENAFEEVQISSPSSYGDRTIHSAGLEVGSNANTPESNVDMDFFPDESDPAFQALVEEVGEAYEAGYYDDLLFPVETPNGFKDDDYQLADYFA